MKHFRYTLAAVALYAGLSVQGAESDSLNVSHGIREHLSVARHFAVAAYRNPSAQPYAYNTSLTTLGVSGSYDQQSEALVVQQGQGGRYGAFDAASYLHPGSRNTVWGSAGYRVGRVMHTQWSESADFELLYPYVMADSVGGNLSTERYTFAGGFARQFGRVTWGIEGDYRAEIEFRKIDPRPRNIVSDLNLSTGVSVALGSRYVLGAAVHGRVYRQQNNVMFYSPIQQPKVYQMLGLGMYSTRFSDGNTDLYHKGGSYGASVELFPKDRHGLSISVGYTDFFVRRVLSGLNNLPLTRLGEKTFEGEAAWQSGVEGHLWGVKVSGSYRRRTGTEFVYGDGAGASNYPKIGELDQYRNDRTELVLSGLWGFGQQRSFTFYAEPRIGYYASEASYASPARLMKYDKLGGGAVLTAVQCVRRSMFHLAVSADYFGNRTAEAELTGLNLQEAMGQMLLRQFDRLTSDVVQYGVACRWSYEFSRSLVLYIKGDYRHASYRDDSRADYALLSCGIAF